VFQDVIEASRQSQEVAMSQPSPSPGSDSVVPPAVPSGDVPSAVVDSDSDSPSVSSISTSSSSSSSSSGSSDSRSLPGKRVKAKKGSKKAAAAARRRKKGSLVTDSGSDSFGESQAQKGKRPARKSSGAAKKKKPKVVHEEAIEDNEPEEAIERGKKIRKRDEVSDDEKQEYVKVSLRVCVSFLARERLIFGSRACHGTCLLNGRRFVCFGSPSLCGALWTHGSFCFARRLRARLFCRS
jgi:hypothetical protein